MANSLFWGAKKEKNSNSKGQTPWFSVQCHFIHMLPHSSSHHNLAAQERDISSFMLSGEPGNRPWAGGSGEGRELEWVSGWDNVLVKEISINYNERQRRHLSPMQPRRPGSFGQKGKTLALGPMLSPWSKKPAFGEGGY